MDDKKKSDGKKPDDKKKQDIKKKSEDKPKKKSDKSEKSEKSGGLKKLFSDIRSEFTKIIWVSKEELVKQTITVIFVSLFFGLIIFGMDAVFNAGYDFLVRLVY